MRLDFLLQDAWRTIERNVDRRKNPYLVNAPQKNAPIENHVEFLLRAKEYVASFPVPEDLQGRIVQYSHAGKPLLGDGYSPAITDCCYTHFNRNLVSFGFADFVAMAEVMEQRSDGSFKILKPRFNLYNLGNSFKQLLTRYGITNANSETKAGHYLPTRHLYCEIDVASESLLKAGQKVVEFYTTTDIKNPLNFLEILDREMTNMGYPPRSRDSGPHPTQNIS